MNRLTSLNLIAYVDSKAWLRIADFVDFIYDNLLFFRKLFIALVIYESHQNGCRVKPHPKTTLRRISKAQPRDVNITYGRVSIIGLQRNPQVLQPRTPKFSPAYSALPSLGRPQTKARTLHQTSLLLEIFQEIGQLVFVHEKDLPDGLWFVRICNEYLCREPVQNALI